MPYEVGDEKTVTSKASARFNGHVDKE